MNSNLIGLRLSFTLNPEDKSRDHIEADGRIVAVWAEGPRLWFGVKSEGVPYPCTVQACDCEIEGWEL